MEKIVNIDYDKLGNELTKENAGSHLLHLLEKCISIEGASNGFAKLIYYNGKAYRIMVNKTNPHVASENQKQES